LSSFEIDQGANKFVPASIPLTVRDLTDEQWERIEPLLCHPSSTLRRRGRPGVDLRRVVDGIFWLLHHQAPWNEMPSLYPTYQTCHRYFLPWFASGVLSAVAIELFGTDAMCVRYAARRRDR